MSECRLAAGGSEIRTPSPTVWDSIPSEAASDQSAASHKRILTNDRGRFTVRRARLAPAMISTPGHRASRRRQRGALPAWSLFGRWQAVPAMASCGCELGGSMTRLTRPPNFSIGLKSRCPARRPSSLTEDRPKKERQLHRSTLTMRRLVHSFPWCPRAEPRVLRDALREIVDKLWRYCVGDGIRGRTVTLKVRFANFQIITRSRTSQMQIRTRDEFEQLGDALLEPVFPVARGIRLLGISVSSLAAEQAEQPQFSLPV